MPRSHNPVSYAHAQHSIAGNGVACWVSLNVKVGTSALLNPWLTLEGTQIGATLQIDKDPPFRQTTLQWPISHRPSQTRHSPQCHAPRPPLALELWTLVSEI